jgi:hypothetical protein
MLEKNLPYRARATVVAFIILASIVAAGVAGAALGRVTDEVRGVTAEVTR